MDSEALRWRDVTLSIGERVRRVNGAVKEVDYGVLSTPHLLAEAIPASTTDLQSGTSRQAPRVEMIILIGRTELNGILAFISDGGDDPNYIPIGLLPPNRTV
jgi:hypothetical protein